jgi:hypothetical protein
MVGLQGMRSLRSQWGTQSKMRAERKGTAPKRCRELRNTDAGILGAVLRSPGVMGKGAPEHPSRGERVARPAVVSPARTDTSKRSHSHGDHVPDPHSGIAELLSGRHPDPRRTLAARLAAGAVRWAACPPCSRQSKTASTPVADRDRWRLLAPRDLRLAVEAGTRTTGIRALRHLSRQRVQSRCSRGARSSGARRLVESTRRGEPATQGRTSCASTWTSSTPMRPGCDSPACERASRRATPGCPSSSTRTNDGDVVDGLPRYGRTEDA